MDVQVFGTAKCKSTQKALRFFKERRIPVHYVDPTRKAASKRELDRFAQKFGADALLDRDSKRFRERGLHVAHLPESRILPLLLDEPLQGDSRYGQSHETSRPPRPARAEKRRGNQ